MSAEAYRLIGCIPYSQSLPCFALPVFAKSIGKSEFYTQNVDEIGETIQRFDILEGYDTSEMLPATGELRVLGDLQIYCFIDERNIIHHGSLENIGPFLREAMLKHSNNPSVYLQLAELVGSLAERGNARARMRRTIRQISGDDASSSFYNVSILHSVLWDALAGSVSDSGALRRIMNKRAQLRVSISNDKLHLNLNAVAKEDLNEVDMANVLMILNENHQASYDNEVLLFDNDTINIERSDFNYEKLLSEIKKLGRQEDRIVVVIDAILRDRNAGRIMFNEYKKDRGKFATWAIERLRALLFLNSKDEIVLDIDSKSAEEIETLVANFIPEMYKNIFPMNRGYFVFSLLRYLRWNSRVMSEISEIIHKSNNSDVGWYVDHFEERYGPLETA